MFEGKNTVTFSKETAYRLFSSFLSSLLNNPIKVTEIESDYKGVTIDFTEGVVKEEKEDAEPKTKEISE